MGRRAIPIDAAQVVKLARIGCTEEEIADILGASQQTISRRFRVDIARARGLLKMSLRRAQYHRAVKDRSDRMLIHLGVALLGQGATGGGDDWRDIMAEIAGAGGEAGGDPGDPGEVPQ